MTGEKAERFVVLNLRLMAAGFAITTPPTHRLVTPELQQRNRTRLMAGLKAAS